jgi:hypothetical protein
MDDITKKLGSLKVDPETQLLAYFNKAEPLKNH